LAFQNLAVVAYRQLPTSPIG